MLFICLRKSLAVLDQFGFFSLFHTRERTNAHGFTVKWAFLLMYANIISGAVFSTSGLELHFPALLAAAYSKVLRSTLSECFQVAVL